MRSFLHKKIKNAVLQLISSTKNFDVENAISIFCDPRGGSTWLAELLNNIPKTLIIDEPLHINNNKAINELQFSWRQHIPEESNWPEAKEFFKDVLRGKSFSATSCCRNSVLEAIRSKQVILKIIRGKALLPWYAKQFEFKYLPVFVVRNPFALVASQSEHVAWGYKHQKFKLPNSPFNEFYEEHFDYLTSLETTAEQLTAFWCMTNNAVLQNVNNNKSWISINYEDLVLNPVSCFQQIFDRWDLEIPDRFFEKMVKPSSSTIGRSSIDPMNQVMGWKSKINEKEINALKKVLDYFEIKYYRDEALPLIPASEVHLRYNDPSLKMKIK